MPAGSTRQPIEQATRARHSLRESSASLLRPISRSAASRLRPADHRTAANPNKSGPAKAPVLGLFRPRSLRFAGTKTIGATCSKPRAYWLFVPSAADLRWRCRRFSAVFPQRAGRMPSRTPVRCGQWPGGYYRRRAAPLLCDGPPSTPYWPAGRYLSSEGLHAGPDRPRGEPPGLFPASETQPRAFGPTRGRSGRRRASARPERLAGGERRCHGRGPLPRHLHRHLHCHFGGIAADAIRRTRRVARSWRRRIPHRSSTPDRARAGKDEPSNQRGDVHVRTAVRSRDWAAAPPTTGPAPRRLDGSDVEIAEHSDGARTSQPASSSQPTDGSDG